jgi:hypothetical protein
MYVRVFTVPVHYNFDRHMIVFDILIFDRRVIILDRQSL